MRDIKFRAWLKKEKKMVEVHKLNFKDKIMIHYLDDLPFPTLTRNAFEDIELMQYTSFIDKNHTQVYEGDCFWIEDYKDYGQVVWNEMEGGYGLLGVNFSWGVAHIGQVWVMKMEVKGNIYEHKHLFENNEETDRKEYEF